MGTPPISPETAMGAVHLTVSDLDRSLDFYTETIGMRILERQGSRAFLGAGDRPLKPAQ